MYKITLGRITWEPTSYFSLLFRSQANDMAIQMARAYTGNYDVLIFEESFHGGLSTGADMSAKVRILIFACIFSIFFLPNIQRTHEL